MRTKNEKNKPVVLESQLMPYDLELEASVLSAIFIEPKTLIDIGKDFSVSLFYDERHKLIAEAIIDLNRTASNIDIITIINQLRKVNKLENVGGVPYITAIANKVSSNISIKNWVKFLQQKALERSLIYISNNTLVRVLNYKDDIFEVFSATQQQLDDALKSVINLDAKSIKDIHFDVLQRNINAVEHGIKSGVPTGWYLLDNVTGGWQETDLIIMAGRPSMGKTACAVSACIYPSFEKNIPVAIFSLEMSAFQLVCRIQSYISEINVDKIIKGSLTMDEIRHIDNSCVKIPETPLYIDDTPNISLMELKNKCRKLVNENGVKLVVIDYLQLMRSGYSLQNREQEIAEISKGLKALAKELNIPIIALSQLSRMVESRQDKKPMLSDLRESGQIEQDADMVIFPYRPQYYGVEQYEIGNQTIQTDDLMLLIVAKHRNGELGEMPMKFIGRYTKVLNHELFNSGNRQSLTPPNELLPPPPVISVPADNFKPNSLPNNNDFLNDASPAF